MSKVHSALSCELCGKQKVSIKKPLSTSAQLLCKASFNNILLLSSCTTIVTNIVIIRLFIFVDYLSSQSRVSHQHSLLSIYFWLKILNITQFTISFDINNDGKRIKVYVMQSISLLQHTYNNNHKIYRSSLAQTTLLTNI